MAFCVGLDVSISIFSYRYPCALQYLLPNTRTSCSINISI